MTNVHGIDIGNILVPAAVGMAIIKNKIDWRDAVRCVASGKDPSILLADIKAAKPRETLENAPDFDQEKAVKELQPKVPEEAPKISELALSMAEGRAPVIEKLTPEELSEQAKRLGIDPLVYSTQAGLVRAIRKKME